MKWRLWQPPNARAELRGGQGRAPAGRTPAGRPGNSSEGLGGAAGRRNLVSLSDDGNVLRDDLPCSLICQRTAALRRLTQPGSACPTHGSAQPLVYRPPNAMTLPSGSST